jgi:ribonucleoside-diphosphate reductase alpha chain
MALLTGAGIGIDYSDIREEGAPIKRTGGLASGPISLMHSINEIGRQVMQGGSRRSAIWAGLSWKHPDIFKFIRVKDWAPELRELKARDHEFPMTMELTNISVQLDDEFFIAYQRGDQWARDVYNMAVKRMAKTGEPGFSIDVGTDETLRNACTEITSADDSDICNLGSLNLARIENLNEMKQATELAALFLLAGTEYSDVPYPKVAEVRERNRRLGLGLMGLHEWLLSRGRRYGEDSELGEWLAVYEGAQDHAERWADHHSLSRPVKTRAIAPTGTIAILGETTTGIEPIYCAAYERRWSKGDGWHREYVVDPTAQRLVDQGVKADEIEDAFAVDLERRLQFQAWVQRYVDHGISSTINLPAPIENADKTDELGEMLMRYIPELRGVTVYPNGARAGQPITPVPFKDAIRPVIEVSDEACLSGACGV